MKLKFFTLILALILSLSCFISCSDTDGGADTTHETGAITGDNNETDRLVDGGTLVVSLEIVESQLLATVSIRNNTGIAGFYVGLGFDNTKLTPVDFVGSDLVDYEVLLSNAHQGGDVVKNLTEVTAQYANPTNFTSDGALFVFAFDIIDADAKSFEISINEYQITNQNRDKMIFNIENCTLNID